ncbi:hypothetical protein DFJ66_7858 [Saccharothrix variisporea]|uniref:Uncharacterized protein n=1 Tax=Saccharothrix variisporea TaxID=543527 RepID=A0A495XS43_9PSEU|nr:hypothetical protein DFJ66_7858 [Saccharothrix variisporea]
MRSARRRAASTLAIGAALIAGVEHHRPAGMARCVVDGKPQARHVQLGPVGFTGSGTATAPTTFTVNSTPA